MSHYIATDTDRTAIYGIGDSHEEAIADAMRSAVGDYITVACQHSLLIEVTVRGGAIAWRETDGVAHLAHDLIDYYSNETIREATPDEIQASFDAASLGDACGCFVAVVDGEERVCYTA